MLLYVDSEDSDQTGQMLDAQSILLVLSCAGSFRCMKTTSTQCLYIGPFCNQSVHDSPGFLVSLS